MKQLTNRKLWQDSHRLESPAHRLLLEHEDKYYWPLTQPTTHGRVSACIAKCIAVCKLSIHGSVTPFHQHDIAAHTIPLPLGERTTARFKLHVAMLSLVVYLGGTLTPVELLGTELGCLPTTSSEEAAA